MKLVLPAVLLVACSVLAPVTAIAPAHAAEPLVAATDACGPRPAKPDGTLWQCTFDDEFSGKQLDRSRWVPQTAGFMTGTAAAYACYLDDPSTVGVSNGALNLTVRTVATPVTCSENSAQAPTSFVGGSVSTYHLFSQQYGRFEARIRSQVASSPGLHEAFWLWPDDRIPSAVGWPAAGEIDVAETYSTHPGLAIPFLHSWTDILGPQPGVNTAWNCAAHRGDWNTYTLEWGPAWLAIYVNGSTCLVNTSGDPAFQKPYIAALTAGLGAAGNEYQPGTTPLPATMSVDYVRVWK